MFSIFSGSFILGDSTLFNLLDSLGRIFGDFVHIWSWPGRSDHTRVKSESQVLYISNVYFHTKNDLLYSLGYCWLKSRTIWLAVSILGYNMKQETSIPYEHSLWFIPSERQWQFFLKNVNLTLGHFPHFPLKIGWEKCFPKNLLPSIFWHHDPLRNEN